MTSGGRRVGETHKCRVPGCERQVPRKLLMCFPHWKLVPAPLQRDVWHSFERKFLRGEPPTRRYAEAVRRAVASVVEQIAPAERTALERRAAEPEQGELL